VSISGRASGSGGDRVYNVAIERFPIPGELPARLAAARSLSDLAGIKGGLAGSVAMAVLR